MEATVVLVLFLAVICGGMTLMLSAGLQNAEKERARLASEERAQPVATASVPIAASGFFAVPATSIPSMPFVFDDALVRQLEQYVRTEQAAVAQFVHRPSVDSLYHPTGASLHVH